MAVKQRICVAENHTILREGLRALLATDPTLQVVCEAGDGFEVIDCVRKHVLELVLLDLLMPRMNGLEAIREIRKRSPNTKILVLTGYDIEEYVFEALQAGAAGYVLKDTTHAELLVAVHTVLRGKIYLGPGASEKVVKGYLQARETPTDADPRWNALTHRERELLKLIAENHTNKQIAGFLDISVKTVETHRTNLMRKLDVHSAVALTAYAINRGLVSK